MADTPSDLAFPSDLHIAADNHAVAGTGESIFKSAADLATKGSRLTALSIYNSFVNTGVELNNWLGGSWEKNDAEKQLQSYDDDLARYYTEHKQGLETAGLIAGSFIPGLLAVKGLKLAMAGRGTANFEAATGLLAPMRTKVLQEALAEIEAGPLSMTGIINTQKNKAIMLGFADQAMQAAAWEIATVATMKANPMLDDLGYKDIVSDIFFGTLLGGAIGGGIEMLGTRKFFRDALTEAADKRMVRQFVERPGAIDVIEGDRLAVLLNSLDQLPEGTTKAEKATLKITQDQTELDAIAILVRATKNAEGKLDNDLGIAMWGLIKKMREAGQPAEEITAKLARLARIDRLNEGSHLVEPDRFFFNATAGGMKAGFESLVTNTPTPGSGSYRLAAGMTADRVRIGRFASEYTLEAGGFEGRRLAFTSPKEAFEDGLMDLYLDSNLKIHVNPKSEVITQVPHAGQNRILSREEEMIYATTGKLPDGAKRLLDNRTLINVKTGAQTDTALPTIGDLSKPADIKLNDRGITYGTGAQPSIHYVENGYNYQNMTAVDANARYVWAHLRSLRPGGAFDKGNIVHIDDIPMMEQIYYALQRNQLPDLKKLGVKLRGLEGEVIEIPGISDFQRMISDGKDRVIGTLLKTEGKSITAEEAAMKANVPVSYIENGTVSKSFEELLIPASEHMDVTHVKLNYDISNVATNEGNIARGMVDVQTRINYAAEQAANAARAFFGTEYERIAIRQSARDAKVTGAGPTAFTSADADYGTLAQKVELTGTQVRAFYTQKVKDAMDNMLSVHQRIEQDTTGILGAELRTIVTALRNTGQQYVFVPQEIVQRYAVKAHVDPSKGVIALKQSIVRDPKTKEIIDWKWDYTPPKDVEKGIPFVRPYDPRTGATREGKLTFHQLSPEVSGYLRQSGEINDTRLIHENNRRGAIGNAKTLELGTVYAPAIDTRKYPFVALIRDIPEKGNSSSSVSAVVAQSQEALEAKVGLLAGEYQILYKKTSADYHKVLGDYEYNMNLTDNVVDNDLRRRGILSDFLPNMRTADVLKEFTDWHAYQETRLARNYVELANAQLFEELRALGKPYTAAATSKAEKGTVGFERTVTNPFDSYIKTALDISEKSEYRLWQDANEKLEAFFSSAFNKARDLFGDAQKGLVSYEKANEILAAHGLKNPYGETWNNLAAWREANRRPMEPVLSRFVQKMNSVLSATAIRLDAMQSLVNVISTPVMMLGEMQSIERKIKFKQLTDIPIPDGSGNVMPGKVKLIYNAVNNFFGENSKELMRFYREDAKTVRELGSEFQDMLTKMAITGTESASTLEKLGTEIVNKGAKLSGANWSEEFVRFVASDVARQSFEHLGYTGVDLINNIRTFVNRVHGNSVASQRPIAFQGVMGQAIGLFQTYQFNLLQQTFKHIEAGDYKAIAMMGAMQTSLFGFQGLPGFQAINTHIIGNAANNPNHNDVYSVLPNLTDKKLGDYLLYGVTSNWMGSAIYTRGDINPRQLTILPVNPLDIPAVSSGIRFVSNVVNTVQKINDGGRFGETILNGLEHNGLSRPLAGLSQVVQGYSTTSKGSLISASNDWNSIASASRILGARPLDEAVVMDAMFRKTAYDAKDSAQIGQLGEAVKTTLYANGTPTESEISGFAAEYASRGGRIENFNRKMIEWTKGANSSVANEVYKHLKSGTAVNVMKMMGGQPLPDFTNAGTTPASTGQQ